MDDDGDAMSYAESQLSKRDARDKTYYARLPVVEALRAKLSRKAKQNLNESQNLGDMDVEPDFNDTCRFDRTDHFDDDEGPSSSGVAT